MKTWTFALAFIALIGCDDDGNGGQESEAEAEGESEAEAESESEGEFGTCVATCGVADDCCPEPPTGSCYWAASWDCVSGVCIYNGCDDNTDCVEGGIPDGICVADSAGNFCIEPCDTDGDCDVVVGEGTGCDGYDDTTGSYCVAYSDGDPCTSFPSPDKECAPFQCTPDGECACTADSQCTEAYSDSFNWACLRPE